ncbi:cysteine-rich repeat secretory protein 38-like [Glycine soja]|nr:cysteine-rich repeat secretory protein 38-like [Glycine soja]
MAAVSCVLLFFLSCLFLKSISQASAQTMLTESCDNNSNGTYNTNLNTLLSTLSSNTEINYGFYNFSYGQNEDKVNAIGLCRGDLKPDECRSCLNDARSNLTVNCPNQEEEKEGILHLDKCMLRYSNRSIFGVMETSPTLYMWNSTNATDVDQFNQVLQNLMRTLTERAASGDSRRKYAEGSSSAPNFQTIHGLVQCTPDLSQQDCKQCLDRVAISQIPSCCNGKIMGGKVLTPSCNARFETYRHLPSSKGNSDASRTVLVAMAVLVVSVDLVLGFI